MLNITNPYNNQIIQSVQKTYIQDLNDRERAHMQEYIDARQYYDGSQKTQLTDRQRQYLQVSKDANFTVNYCPMVVNAKADRLKVSGFDTDDAQKEIIWKWWRRNRMDGTQNIVHRNAIRDGDAFVLVEWDAIADMPRFYFEPAYAGEGVMVYYSDERRTEIEFASKRWQIKHGVDVGKKTRINLYFPNRIEKYVAHDDVISGQMMPFEDDTTEKSPGRLGMAGVNWWTADGTETGEPLGIPIVHFKNDDNGDSYGTSALAKVMPIQDAVNKAMIDLLGAMDANGFPTFVGYGGTEWNDMKVGPGAINSTSKAQDVAKLDTLEAMSPAGLLSVYNALVMEVMRVSGTPLSYAQLSGQVAAEGTMKQQETALVTQVEKSQTDFGNNWEDCMNIARRLHNAFSNEAPLDEDEIIDTIWEQAESRNDKEQADTLALRVEKLGVSEDQAQVEMGYDSIQRASFVRAKLRKQALALRNMAATPQNEQPEQNSSETLSQTENEDIDESSRAPPTQ